MYDQDGKSSLFKRFSVSCQLQPKVLSVFNQENAVFEVLIRKIKVQSSIILCMQRTSLVGLKAIARDHSQLVKQRLKKLQSFIFASFTVKTGFSEQVIQSSVRGRHCYNPKSVDRK